MANCKKLLKKCLASPNNISFPQLISLAQCWGFEPDRTRGSHRVFKHVTMRTVLTFQERTNGGAKPYQVRQLLAHIELIEKAIDMEQESAK